jgi:sigma-B regulation protein RsbU (phosphoserine phosphatase)
MANLLLQVPAFLRRLNRLEKVFLILCLLDLIYRATHRLSGIILPLQALLDFSLTILAVVLGFTYLRRLIRRLLWRLRNRLIITYVFIGVVPIVLVLAMLGIALYILMGQVATYMVTTELKRRNDLVRDCAYGLAWNVADHRRRGNTQASANEFLKVLRGRHPHLQAVVQVDGRTFSVPADAVVKDIPPWSKPGFAGLLSAGLAYALAAHIQASDSVAAVQVFAYEPADSDLLARLLPGLASIQFLQLENTPGGGRRLARQREENDPNWEINFTDPVQFATLPPARAWWDIVVSWGTPIPLWKWENEGGTPLSALVVVRSRPSLIINQLFSTSEEWASALKLALVGIGVLFLSVEIVSLFSGVGLTRTITRSIADLYEATRKIKVGDFSHRIPIRTHDQLSELAGSFNSMTENIQKLILESKEKERLESELEIAREVQSQLFPKEVPRLKTLELDGVCNPARTVSGDYYDFVSIESCWTALAIGDIAGKGISAALLMASIQSSLRAQLTYRNGPRSNRSAENTPISTSSLVTLLNQQLYENTSPEKFASFYCGVYDDRSGRLFYTNAGHLPPILIRQGKASRLAISGMVLGVLPNNHYDQDCVELQPGDLLVAFTDGITEPENEYGEEFGEKRLTELLLRNARRPLKELVAVVTGAVSEWSNSPEQQDDMTLLVARRV